MKKKHIIPTDKEMVMRENDFIVSKTDPKGRITYGNQIFIEFSGYTEKELLGAQHNIIRHPDMPRAVFNLLWDTVTQGRKSSPLSRTWPKTVPSIGSMPM